MISAAGAALALLCGAARAQDEAPPAPPEERPGQPSDVEEIIEFSPTSEPVELMELVNFVAEELEINVSAKGTITGQVMFNAQQAVPRPELLSLLEALLTQHDYSLIRDPTGIYLIQPVAQVTRSFESEFATTKIISTPNVKPSALKPVLEPGAIGGGGGGGGTGAKQIAYVDDLSVIVVTDTPRNVRATEELIRRLLDEYGRAEFTRIDLDHVAATAARERAIYLVGQGGSLRPTFPGQETNIQQPGQAQTLDNLADRLTVDPGSNALIFRGTEAEVAQVREILDIIDVPTTLKPEEYFAGSSASTIADIASRRGLGDVIRISDTLEDQTGGFQPFSGNLNRNQLFPGQQEQTALGGGSVMMVDEMRGQILYYGTPEQQAQLSALIDVLRTDLEQIVIVRYPVRNVQAVDLATLLNDIIRSDTDTGSPLLPGARGSRTGSQQPNLRQLFEAQAEAGEGDGETFALTASDAFVAAHEETNVVIVKAPRKLQEQFADLINQLDVRRPQVYIEAQIVAISNSRDFRLAVEGQIQAGQFQASTAFGLGSFGEEGAFTDRKLPVTGLAGLTTALIKSEYVPVIINALQRDTDAKIISTPQLLVNDNEEAEIVSLEEQPFTNTQVSQTTDITSFGGYEEAGTILRVTPSISEVGYLRLAYEIELSNFAGTGSDGIPPPRNTRNVSSESVTIPTDTTIVVGGITVTDVRDTVVKVPLLGDIPLLGLLFRDTNKVNSEAVLYVFLTPRILNDRNFADLRLLTKGPQAAVGLEPDLPKLTPSYIELLPMRPAPGAESPPVDHPTIVPLEDDEAGVVRRSEDG